jgi:hypothetical protein
MKIKKNIYIIKKMSKKTRSEPTQVNMQNLRLSHDTKVTMFESKINKIMKLNYRTAQC